RSLPHRGRHHLHVPGRIRRRYAGTHHRRDRGRDRHRARRHPHGRPDLRRVDGASQARGLLLMGLHAIAPGTLRFTTAGSVDDGKSTLIGRLLLDAKGLLEDQLAAVARTTSRRGGAGLDLALFTDGLTIEREQGITVDVAYRYFATPRRRFIIADTPGHEQYTRNMVTGASTADLSVILVDAARGISEQTRRHAAVAALLGIPHVVVAVNKMDQVGFDR